ncbi:MAG TPA: hypothetical protein PL110_05995 [Candidatus Eremiobacteraeota bacterium]|nr:MAG: hypothetical protein BWY64_00145 [bacterium ADurb.Bin363]HPZ07645.1 hypothetical protein [Candidatus Eremiobacteraeota bacterium]
MSEKKKLGRGLADVMDVFFPVEEEKKEKKIRPTSEVKGKKDKIVLSLRDNMKMVKENTYSVEYSVSDSLSLNLTPYEEVIYNKFYRLSFGEGRNYCQIGYGSLVECSSLNCTRTAKLAIESLIEKKYMARINIGEKERKSKGTLYRIFLASEIISGKTVEGIELSLIDGKSVEAIKETIQESSID